MVNRNWRLPEGVDELLPPAAWQLELTRRKVLDVFHAWGFDYIEPPMIEYLDSLLAVGSDDLDLQTLKVVDQRSGRMLGVRADLTSQAVRVDAHSLESDDIRRFCYAGTVVHANPAATLDSRVPLKAGAEIFGSTSVMADAEMITLLIEVLHATGIDSPILVLGHMGIYRSLVSSLALDAATEARVFAAVQSKSEADIEALLGSDGSAELMRCLPGLMGGADVLDSATALFTDAADVGSQASSALADIRQLAVLVGARCPGISVRFDLAELAGYGYHNGPVFSAFHADHGRALARGGRYDGIGAAYGSPRPATGFDVSLKELVQSGQPERAVWVAWSAQAQAKGSVAAGLGACIKSLRAAGEVVVLAVAESEPPASGCDRELICSQGDWQVRDL